MEHFETTLTASDGLQLYCQGWEPPESQARAAICLVHGLGEHSGRYAHVADFFTQAGYAVIAADLRGHGKSGGQRGHATARPTGAIPGCRASSTGTAWEVCWCSTMPCAASPICAAW